MLRQQLREVQQSLSAFRLQMDARRSPCCGSATSKRTVRSIASQWTMNTSVWSPSSDSSYTESSTSNSDNASIMSYSCQLSDSNYTLSSREDMSLPDGRSESSSFDDASLEPSTFESSTDSSDYYNNCTYAHNLTQTFVSDCVSKLMFGDSRVNDLTDTDMECESGHSQNCSDDSLCSRVLQASNNNREGNSSVDSDASAFMDLPLCRLPVTHKSTKHSSMTKHLKRVGKQIRKHGLHNLMDTLAIL